MFHVLLVTVICYINTARVAIIGGGIGGASTAYYLSKNKDFQIDLYEKSNRVGGRVYAEKIQNRTINLGASFLIKDNLLLHNLINELKLDLVRTATDKKTAIISGNEIVFKFSNYNIVNIVKLLWNYGFSPLKVKMICNHYLNRFKRIYELLANKHIFTNLEDFLKTLELDDLVGKTIKTFLIENGVSEHYVNDIIDAFMAGIYNQHSEINAFAGFITLAGVSYETFEVVGGNNMIIIKLVEKLREYKNFNLYLNKTVTTIRKRNDTYFVNGKEYDYVIISCPIDKTGIKFENITLNNSGPHDFQTTYMTVIQGSLNNKYFNLPDDTINTIISNKKNSTDHISDVIYVAEGLIKVQSDQPVLHTNIVKNDTVLKRHVWDFAYPRLRPIERKDLPSFILDKGLYYINAIESAGSCMELSMISARNIINIIENKTAKESRKSEL
jgi:prenylcysteine oxidase/farnesylcysteine lyase